MPSAAASTDAAITPSFEAAASALVGKRQRGDEERHREADSAQDAGAQQRPPADTGRERGEPRAHGQPGRAA